LEQREEAQTPGRTIHNEQPPVTTHKERLIWLHRTMRNNPRQQGENLDLWCNRLALMMMQDERVTKKWTGLQIKRRRLDRPKD
jgi:hypothetical protein